MKKQDYTNPLREQVLSLPKLADIQIENCFSLDKLKEVMSIAEMFDFRKIILTGCGDSLAAAGAMAKPLQRYSDTFGCAVMEPMEFTRFTSKEDIGIGEPNSPLLVAISAGGGSARVVEALEKGNELGAFTVLITNNKESRGAGAARRAYVMDTPQMENDFPGLRSYFANMIGLIALAQRLGHVRGTLGPTSADEFKNAISRYVHSYDSLLDKIDDQMFALAQKWKDFERFDFIGDGEELYSALFGMEKFYECTGRICNYDDSEDWCHINFFVKDPHTVGTVFFADKNLPSFSRTKETIQVAHAIGRPVLVIANAPKEEFAEGVEVCTLPQAPEGFEWLLPLMDFVPAALLAGFCSTLAGRKFFNEYDPIAKEYNGGGQYFNREIMTMSSSEIKIYV